MTAPRDGITRRPLRPVSPACYPVSRFFHTSMCFQDWPGLLLSQRAPSTARAPHGQVAALAAGPVRTTGPAQHPDGWPVALCDACYFVIYVLSHLWKLLLLMVFNIMAQTGKKRVPFWLIERSTELHALAASCQLCNWFKIQMPSHIIKYAPGKRS